MRWALSSALFVALLTASLASERQTAPSSDRREALNAIINDFVSARKAFTKARRMARTEDEQKLALAKMPKDSDYLPRLFALLEADKNDEVATEALAFAVFGLDTNDKRVFELLANVTKTQRIERFVHLSLKGAPESTRPVLAKVLADNPSKELKGFACFALGTMALESDDPKAAKEAQDYFERVEREFFAVKTPDGQTLGEMAKSNLFELRNLVVGQKAPNFVSKGIDGKPTSLADYAGKVIVLDFWATWCGPCREMIPHEKEIVEKHKGKPFALISVSVDDEKRELEEFLTKGSMPWVHWWDNGQDSASLKQWNVNRYPTIYIIDAKGIIRLKLSPSTPEAMKVLRTKVIDETVAKLLAEVGK